MEAIWNGMLSPEERNNILEDERANGGTFVDRVTGKTYEYADAPEQILKERIMDDFSDFRLSKLPASSLGERIQRFFRAILDFFSSFVSNPSLKEQLFKEINSGKFNYR